MLCIAAMLAPACSGRPEDEALRLSNEEIAFHVSEWTPMMQSRAELFESGDDLLNTGKGGGNFTLYARVDGTDNTYINGVRVWYFDDPQVRRWVFLNSSGAPITYYWPNSNALNFFACMPDSRYDGKDGYRSKPTYVTLGAYTDGRGQTFSCELPAVVSYETAIQEFIYASEEHQMKKSDAQALRFRHPFAAVNFQVKSGSYRMTINSIEFNPIHLKGEFSTAEGAWTPEGTDENKTAYSAVIDKRIPNSVNYNTPLGEPFIVMPQKLDGVRLVLNAQRSADNESEATPLTASVDLSGSEWLPGKIYMYTISVGDNNAEIYFNVSVDEDDDGKADWIAEGETDIDVE